MNKKNVTVIVSVLLVAVLVVLLILFGSKKEVKFDSQGGSSVTTQDVRFMSKVKKPTAPVREGYTFDNWYYNDAVFDFDTKVTKGMTLIARWIKNGEGTSETGYTVTFNTDGGNVIASLKVDAEGTIEKPQDPVREGYKFVGWQMNGKDFDFKTKITQNTVLTAKWEKEEETNPTGGEKTPKLSSGNFTLNVGKSKKLSVYNTSSKVSWKSSNSKVATVDSNGKVVGVSSGTATITAIVDGKSYSVKVTVKSNNSGNQGGNTPVDPEPPKPEEPKPVDPKPEVTYRAVCEEISGSTLQQCQIKILGSDGKYVSGKVRVETTTGGSGEVNTGYTLPKSSFKSATVISTN